MICYNSFDIELDQFYIKRQILLSADLYYMFILNYTNAY